MRMGDKGFYFGLRHFNFSGAEFWRERKRKKGEGKKGREYLSETYKTCNYKNRKTC